MLDLGLPAFALPAFALPALGLPAGPGMAAGPGLPPSALACPVSGTGRVRCAAAGARLPQSFPRP